MFCNFTSLLLTQKYPSPGTINEFPLDYYIASKKGRKLFLCISKAHMIYFSLNSLSCQMRAQTQPKPHMVKKPNNKKKNTRKKPPPNCYEIF